MVILLCALTALHLRYAFIFRVDSDETQHLHVIWGWTQGQLPYRDFFDNHAPLFSWLCAPLLGVLGERTDIVSWMRLATLILIVPCLVCTYRLGSFHFGRRAAGWAVILTGFFPVFFYTSSEVRPDTLWTALWLLSLAILLTGRATTRRMFFFGVVLGLAFATSLKTVLLAATLVLAWLLAFAAGWPRVNMVSASRWSRGAIALMAGLLLAPGAFAVFFALQGGWKLFVYCLVVHNVLPGMSETEGWLRPRSLLFPVALPVLYFSARALWRRPGAEADPWRRQRIVLLLAAFCYPLLLVSFWPLLTRQDYLPAIPLLALALVAPFFLPAPAPAGKWPPQESPAAIWPPLLAASLILAEVLAIFWIHGPWRDRTTGESKLLAASLRLTTPRDFVMDLKGETIFRRRPFYYALEGITIERIRRGLIQDDIAQRLVATHTAAVHSTKAYPLPTAAQAFVDRNYVPVGPLSVLGQVIEPKGRTGAGDSRAYDFEIAVPGNYVVIDPEGRLAAGRLDGEAPAAGGRSLQAGPHEFSSLSDGRLIVFWARAWKEGFRPLTPSPLLIGTHG
jgi:hypothetical protein